MKYKAEKATGILCVGFPLLVVWKHRLRTRPEDCKLHIQMFVAIQIPKRALLGWSILANSHLYPLLNAIDTRWA